MPKLLSAALTLALVAALVATLPSLAFAKQNKNKKRRANAPAVHEVVEHPGNGLSPGGVPALRDDVVGLEDRVYALESRIAELEDSLDEGMESVLALIDGLSNEVEGLGDSLSALDTRVADLEADASDDDGDGFSENFGDCDDANPDVSPTADEIPDNGIDDDCDFELDEVDADPAPPVAP